jgi:RND family efflux transporter MFP subunit
MTILAPKVLLLSTLAWLGGYAISFGEDAIDAFTEPYRTVEVAASDPGIIAVVHVREGARVQKGDSLVELDAEPLESALAIAQVRRDAAGRKNVAETEYAVRVQRRQKLESLQANGNASQEEVDRALADEQIAAGTLLTVQEELQAAALEVERIMRQIERRRVRAPIDGRVTRVFHEPSEYVSMNQPSVATLVQLDPLRVVLFVPVNQVDRVREGEQLSIHFPDLQSERTATIEYVAPLVDAESGTVEVQLAVPNPGETIRGGTRCHVQLP